MKIIVATMGSAGDLHPFYSIGLELKKRGHDIVFLSGETYRDEINQLGFRFIPIAAADGWQHIIDIFDPEKLEQIIPIQYKYLIIDTLKPIYDAVHAEYVAGNTVLICWQLLAGARIACEKLKIPMATVVFAPSSFRSLQKPPRYSEHIMPSNTPKGYYLNIEKMMDSFLFTMLGKSINDFRTSMNLGRVDAIFNWVHSPQKIIGLFPDWFAHKQDDWLAQAELTTFPLFNGGINNELQPELMEFLENGDAPVVFTPGSQFNKGKEYFQAAMDACVALQKRALFIAKFSEQIPKNLPDNIRHFSYAEFSKLLPHASLLVHHGGIGTCAQALHAGIPQIIVPWGLDQYDNAAHIKELGIGDEINQKELSPKLFIEKITHLSETASVKENCKKYAKKLSQLDPITKTCNIIEDLGK